MAINFQPTGNTTFQQCTTLDQIDSLPAVCYSTLSNFDIVTLAADHESYRNLSTHSNAAQFTGMLQIIGARTNDPTVFTKQLIERNRWLQLKYLHINSIYKTEFSFSNSYNFIVTLDAAAHQACLDFGSLQLSNRCNIYDYSQSMSCSRCHQHDHEIGACSNRVVCKLCANNHHHSTCNVQLDKYTCANCLKANLEGNNFPIHHKATYRGCLSRRQHTTTTALNP